MDTPKTGVVEDATSMTLLKESQFTRLNQRPHLLQQALGLRRSQVISVEQMENILGELGFNCDYD